MPEEAKDLSEALRDPLVALAVAAIYFNTIGVVYSITLFGLFGFNYADFANIQDFLFASFKEPIAFLIGLAALVVIYLSRNRGEGADWKTVSRALVPHAVAALMAALVFLAVRYGDFSVPFSNTGVEVEVIVSNEAVHGEADNEFATVRLIGRAGAYLFFFDKADNDCMRRCHINTIALRESLIATITNEGRAAEVDLEEGGESE